MTLRTSPGPSRNTTPPSGRRQQRTEGAFDPRDVGMGILLVLLGIGLLAGLFQAAETLGFDTLLVASKSIYNVISGVRGIGLGLAQMVLGLTQMLGFAALAVLSIAAVLAILSGAVRIGSHTLPRLNLVWTLLSQSLHLALQFLAVPVAGRTGQNNMRSLRNESQAGDSQRLRAGKHRRAA